MPLLLLDVGPYISTSVNRVPDAAGKSNEEGWINVYGVSDLVSWRATAIAPGATVHDEWCLSPNVFVVSLEKHSRREIPLRGRLRVDALYFLSQKDAETYESQRETMLRSSSEQWSMIPKDPEVATIFIPIPCHDLSCAPACADPPAVLDDEIRVVPDIGYLEPNSRVHGEEIAGDLARKYPGCSQPKSPPR
jgi:hypothetical protein